MLLLYKHVSCLYRGTWWVVLVDCVEGRINIAAVIVVVIIARRGYYRRGRGAVVCYLSSSGLIVVVIGLAARRAAYCITAAIKPAGLVSGCYN